MKTVNSSFVIANDVEITFECNPDDLTLEYLQELKDAGINRLSIGIQSFNDEHLQWMNRSHSHSQSLSAIQYAAQVGFTDITIDLIYGLAQLSIDEWERTVDKALELPINHVSAYSLTLEENTPYNKLVKQKKYKKPNDDLASEHFALLINKIENKGWNHYEVSNFCKDENYSRHNTAYWQNVKYLGIGPSAHSFDGVNRYWNVSSNKDYLQYISSGKNAFEMEELTKRDRLNETILTGLRTKWGIDLDQILNDFDYDVDKLFARDIKNWNDQGWIVKQKGRLKLKAEGFLFADFIASELFLLEW